MNAYSGIQSSEATVNQGSVHNSNARWDLWILPFLIMTMIPLPLTVFSQSPMFRDGSYYFMRIWQAGEVMAPHQRIANWLLQAPTVIAMFVTQYANFEIARLTFCLSYAIIPALSLVMSWLVVGKTRPELMVWPVVAIGLTSLVCRPDSVSENVSCSLLVWPALLGLLSSPGSSKIVFLSLTALFLSFLHPSSCLYLCCMSLSAICLAIWNPKSRKKFGIIAVMLGIFGAGRGLLTVLLPQPYEIGLLSGSCLNFLIESVTSPLTLLAGIGSTAIGITILFNNKFSRIISYALVGVSGISAIAWSVFPNLWYQAFWYQKIMVVYVGILMLCALLDARSQSSDETFFLKKLKFRGRICNLIGLISMLALSAQALSWGMLSEKLKQEIASSTKPIITLEEISWIKETPFDHWSTATYALVLQAHYPCKYILPAIRADEYRKRGSLKLTDWDNSVKGNAFRLPVDKDSKVGD